MQRQGIVTPNITYDVALKCTTGAYPSTPSSVTHVVIRSPAAARIVPYIPDSCSIDLLYHYILYHKPSCFRRHRHQKPTRRPPPPFHPSSVQLSSLNPQNNIIRSRCSGGRCDNNNHVYAFVRRITPSSQRARPCGRLQVLSHVVQLRLQYVRSHFVQITRVKVLRFLRSLASTSSIKSRRRLQRWTRKPHPPPYPTFLTKCPSKPLFIILHPSHPII